MPSEKTSDGIGDLALYFPERGSRHAIYTDVFMLHSIHCGSQQQARNGDFAPENTGFVSLIFLLRLQPISTVKI